MKRTAYTIISLSMAVIVTGLVIVSLKNFYYRSELVTGMVIADDVKKIATMLEKINKDCTIIGFAHQQNPVTFLNVISFSGSEIGSMNLAHAEYWKGPYLEENPEVQGIEYMVVHTNDGYFVTPGNGVTLPNGKIIGKDIIFCETSNIGALMYDKKMLYYNGRPMAAPLSLKQQVVVLSEPDDE